MLVVCRVDVCECVFGCGKYHLCAFLNVNRSFDQEVRGQSIHVKNRGRQRKGFTSYNIY